MSQSQAELASVKQELTSAQQTRISTHAEMVAAQEECAHLRQGPWQARISKLAMAPWPLEQVVRPSPAQPMALLCSYF